MFYDIKNKSFRYDDIFLKDTIIQVNEQEIQAQDTYFLSACDDKLLKELGFARVEEQEIPSFDEKTQELVKSETFNKKANLYTITYEVVEKDLETLKELKLEELKAIKEEKLSFMPFKDTIFQIDTEAKINISGKVSELMLSQLNNVPLKNINWIDRDNQIIEFSPNEFLTFGAGIARYTETIIFKNDALRNRVKNASNKQELDSIVWED